MATQNHVENPFEYVLEKLSWSVGSLGRFRYRPHAAPVPEVRRITAADLRDALRHGLSDFAAARDDVLFIAVIYPLAGLLMGAVALHYELLPMVFPLLSGFALIGPLAAIGLYEISRRREQGQEVSWVDAWRVTSSPALGSIVEMGVILLALFLVWLAVAYELSLLTLGATPPASVGGFVQQVLATGQGWAMIVIGIGVGFLFALLALAISAISFPMMLDRNPGLSTAIRTSLKAVAANPGTMALWGLIVAGLLVLGSIPALVGLVVVVPVLGHATWHLYRKLVV